MRHKFAHKKLNRTSEHRKAMIKNMLNSLIKYEQITTTLPKAKELKPQLDKMITLGKKNNLHSKKSLFSELQSKFSVNKLQKTLSQRYEKRHGGYCRVIRAGFRYGDDAPMAIIELVDRDISVKGYIDKKRVEEQRKHSEQKTPEDKVVNEETQIKSKEKNPKQADDKSQETKQSSSSKKQKKDSKD